MKKKVSKEVQKQNDKNLNLPVNEETVEKSLNLEEETHQGSKPTDEEKDDYVASLD